MHLPHGGLWRFIKRDKVDIFATCAGICCMIACVTFTIWLSNNILTCPSWAYPCTTSSTIETIRRNFGTVQGFVTALYAIGLAALACAAHAFSEAAFWPLLTKRAYTISQIESYIQASHGLVPATPAALFASRNVYSVIVVLCTAIITLTPLAGAPLVGFVYDRGNISVPFESTYPTGGGIGPIYFQVVPVESLRDGAGTTYTSWAQGISLEPMPEYRKWFVNRNSLATRGNMTVEAVRIQQSVNCHAQELASYKYLKKEKVLQVQTQMAEKNATRNKKSDNYIYVRLRERLAVWAHSFEFLSPTRTIATLIFAAVNGTVEGGYLQNFTHGDKNSNVSSIACEVDVELINDVLKIGDGGTSNRPLSTLGSLTKLKVTHPNSTDSEDTVRYGANDVDTLNELVLWLAVAPIANGISVAGTQPMYAAGEQDIRTNTIPRRYTSTNGGNNTFWTIPYIENFIRVSTGAFALAQSLEWPDHMNATLTSNAYTIKTRPNRPFLLLILPGLIIVNGIVLMLLTQRMHVQLQLPIMRKATLSEILKSAQTTSLQGRADEEYQDSAKPSELKKVRVQFGRDDEERWGVHCSGDAVLSEAHKMKVLSRSKGKTSNYMRLGSGEHINEQI